MSISRIWSFIQHTRSSMCCVLLPLFIACQTAQHDAYSSDDSSFPADLSPSTMDRSLPSTDAFAQQDTTAMHEMSHDPAIWNDIPWINLEISADHWQQLQADVDADVEVEAHLSMKQFSTIAVGVEIHGYSSRQFPKQNLKIKLPVAMDLGLFDRPIIGKQVILKACWKDHSTLREALSWYALRQIGFDPPAIQWVHVMMNQEDYGLYQVVEPINLEYFVRRGYTKKGSLYKAVHQSATFAPDKSLSHAFEQKKTYRSADKDQGHTTWIDAWIQANTSDDSFHVLERYLQILNMNQVRVHPNYYDLVFLQSSMQTLSENPSLEDIHLILTPQLDLERLIHRLAWMAYTQASDAVTQNFYLYNIGTWHQPYWHWVNWDADMSFSAFWKVHVLSQPWYNDHLLTGRSFWSKKLVQNHHIRSMLVDFLRETLQDAWSETQMQAYMDQLIQRLAPAIAHDLKLWQRGVELEEVIAPIYAFIHHRPQYLLGLLEDFMLDPMFEAMPL